MKYVFIVCLTVAAIENLLAQKTWVCQEGIPYIENFCNGCGCRNGVLQCTLIGCEHSDYWQKCVDGTTFRIGCNCCRCARDVIGTICTNYNCTTSQVKCNI